MDGDLILALCLAACLATLGAIAYMGVRINRVDRDGAAALKLADAEREARRLARAHGLEVDGEH